MPGLSDSRVDTLHGEPAAEFRSSGFPENLLYPPPRPSAVVLPLPRTTSDGSQLIERASGDRLGPARGLIVGLCLGVVLWTLIGLVAWLAFR